MSLFSCCSCLLAERYSSHTLQLQTSNHSTILRGRPTKFVTSFSTGREAKRILKVMIFNLKKEFQYIDLNEARTHDRAILRGMGIALKVKTKAAMLLSTFFSLIRLRSLINHASGLKEAGFTKQTRL